MVDVILLWRNDCECVFLSGYLEQLQVGLQVDSTKSQSPVLPDSSSHVPFVKFVNFLLEFKAKSHFLSAGGYNFAQKKAH